MPWDDPELDLLPIGTVITAILSTAAADAPRAERYGRLRISPAEIHLASWLYQRRVTNWEQQVPCGPYFIDFVFSGLVAIEVDGAEFHTDFDREHKRDTFIRPHYSCLRHVTAASVFAHTRDVIEEILLEVQRSELAQT